MGSNSPIMGEWGLEESFVLGLDNFHCRIGDASFS